MSEPNDSGEIPGVSTYFTEDMAYLIAVDTHGYVTVHQNCPDGYMAYSLREIARQMDIKAAGGEVPDPDREVGEWRAENN